MTREAKEFTHNLLSVVLFVVLPVRPQNRGGLQGGGKINEWTQEPSFF
jgi:hypothetical protein